MLISCPHHVFITCTNVKVHQFNVPLCVNFSSLNLLLFVINNRTGSTYIDTVHQKVQCFDISRRLGDQAPISQKKLKSMLSTESTIMIKCDNRLS